MKALLSGVRECWPVALGEHKGLLKDSLQPQQRPGTLTCPPVLGNFALENFPPCGRPRQALFLKLLAFLLFLAY